jgi:hypothetical protein
MVTPRADRRSAGQAGPGPVVGRPIRARSLSEAPRISVAALSRPYQSYRRTVGSAATGEMAQQAAGHPAARIAASMGSSAGQKTQRQAFGAGGLI